MMKQYKIKNNDGFSLVQTMVSIAIAAGIALSIMRLTQNANKVSRSAQLREDIRLQMQKINRDLSTEGGCSSLLKGKKLPIRQANEPALEPTFVYDGNEVQKLEITDVDAEGETYKLGEIAIGGLYFNKKYRLFSMGIEGDANNPTVMKIIFEWHLAGDENVYNKATKFQSVSMGKVTLNQTDQTIESCYTYNTSGFQPIGEKEDDEEDTYVTEEQALAILCFGPGATQRDGVCVTPFLSAKKCSGDTPYLHGYAVQSDPELYEPICSSKPWSDDFVAANAEDLKCGDHQVQIGLNQEGLPECKDIPQCGEMEVMRTNDAGEFQCIPLNIEERAIEIKAGARCGLRFFNDTIGFDCEDGETCDDSCDEQVANTCFPTMAPNNECGQSCDRGRKGCCRENGKWGITCTSDEDCHQIGACRRDNDRCIAPTPSSRGYSIRCERDIGMDKDTCDAIDYACEWNGEECVPKPRTCGELGKEDCLYNYMGNPSQPANCQWQVATGKKCIC